MDDKAYETRFLSRKQVRICEVVSSLTWKSVWLVCEQTITTTKLIGPPVFPACFLSYPISRNQELVIDFLFCHCSLLSGVFVWFCSPKSITFELYLCEVTNSSLLSNVPFCGHTAAF